MELNIDMEPTCIVWSGAHVTGSVIASIHCIDPEAQVESLVGGYCRSHVRNTA